MGFFSWKTSDTKKSIRNIHTNQCRRVFLLQPGGEEPIDEPAYEGYGTFGGKNAYAWLAERNLPPEVLSSMDEPARCCAGIALSHGRMIRILASGLLVSVFHDYRFLKACGIDFFEFRGSWDAVIPHVGKSANQLLEDKEAVYVEVRSLVPIRFPLKFSFKDSACYENLPEAETCPDQGFF